MSDQSTELSDLIADARLILAYAARSGRLPTKSLAEAIMQVTSRSEDNKINEERKMALMLALNESLRAIAPITLHELGSRWVPFPHMKGGRFTRFAFSIFAVLLVTITGYYTQLYSQANSILLVLRDIQTQNATDKAERLFRFTFKNHQDLFGLTENKEKIEKMVQTEKKDQDEIIFEPYLKYYVDLLRINDQMITYLPLSIEMVNGRDPVSLIYSWLEGGGYSPANIKSLEEYKEGNYSPLPKSPQERVTLIPDNDIGPVDKLINKQRLLAKFLYYLGVGYLSPSVPQYAGDMGTVTASGGYTVSSLIYKSQKLTALLGIWVLPAMYGLLGAVVFQLRAILNPLIPDPSLERLLIRFSLGALAGVSISWLFGATPGKLFETQSFNSTLFGVSFLFGFSIDVFFALLDRGVEILSGSIAKMGK